MPTKIFINITVCSYIFLLYIEFFITQKKYTLPTTYLYPSVIYTASKS